MRQMAVITPYAQFHFKFVSDAPEYVNIYIYSDSPLQELLCTIILYHLFSFAARMSL